MASSTKLSLKLLVDKNNKKVLFGEAGKDVIDFLFSLLALPIANVIKLLTAPEMVGCLGNLYDSVDNLSDTYIQPHQNKTSLLSPPAPTSVADAPLLLIGGVSNDDRKFYTCSQSSHYGHHYCVTDNSRSRCPDCGSQMSRSLRYVSPKPTTASEAVPAGDGEGGFVKGVVTYMVMDDLTVKPMSTISSISLLTQLRVTDLASLQEVAVEMAMPEGLKLLKASLRCNTVLTSVFLGTGVKENTVFSFPDSKPV